MSRTNGWTAVGATTAALGGVIAGGVLALGPDHAAATGGSAYDGVAECRARDVRATYHAVDAAMSHRYGRITVANTSGAACWIRGYGGLSYVGGHDGTQMGAPATRTPGAEPRTVLQPGDTVGSSVSAAVASAYSPATCQPVRVDGFRVYLPDETHALLVAHPTTGCLSSSVHLLAHQAFHHAR